MIDIHTHILPNIDDGSKSVRETLQMITEARNAGFTHIITTSHFIENSYNAPKSYRRIMISDFQKYINKARLNVELYDGAEIFITPNIIKLLKLNIAPTMAHRRYVLFELPLNAKVVYTNYVIDDLIALGYIPIIAHPERYKVVQHNYKVALEWVERGAYLQANYASIIDVYGKEARKTLLKLLECNAITFLGSDCHRSASIYTKMNEISKRYISKVGNRKFYELSTINPSKIIKNEMI